MLLRYTHGSSWLQKAQEEERRRRFRVKLTASVRCVAGRNLAGAHIFSHSANIPRLRFSGQAARAEEEQAEYRATQGPDTIFIWQVASKAN